MVIDCLQFVNFKKQEVQKKIHKIKQKQINPKLVVINTFEHPSSLSYIKRKISVAEELGIKVDLINYYEDDQNHLQELIQKLNTDPFVHGIILQLPLNPKFNKPQMLNLITASKDVDCLTAHNYAQFLIKDQYTSEDLIPATAKGIWELLHHYWPKQLNGKNVCIVNRSQLVGRPLARLLLTENCTVTICHSQTQNVYDFTRLADIVILGLNSPNFLQPEHVKPEAIIIDVSVNRVNNTLMGDANFNSLVSDHPITKVPGGIGPITVIELYDNLANLILRNHLLQ